MNKRFIILITGVFLTLPVIHCQKPADPHANHVMNPEKISGASLYQFHDKFTDQNNRTLMLHELSGSYIVLSMFYSSCGAICPRIASEMLRLEKSLSSAERAKTKFVMISVDTERDDTVALQKFFKKMHLTNSFTLLRGSPDGVRDVAAALGISYKKLEGGEFSHSSIFTLLSPQGEIMKQRAGLSINAELFREMIQK